MNNRARLVTKLKKQKVIGMAKKVLLPNMSNTVFYPYFKLGFRGKYFMQTYLDVQQAFERYNKKVMEFMEQGRL